MLKIWISFAVSLLLQASATFQDGWMIDSPDDHPLFINGYTTFERVERVDFNVTNADDLSTLFKACYWGFEDIVKLLLEKGVDPNARNKTDGWVPLHAAAGRGHISIITMLLDKGAEIDMKNYDNKTPLYEASYWGQEGAVGVLLKRGASVRIDVSPLHMASARGHYSIVVMLLDAGANVNAVSVNDNTPLYEASYWGKEDIVKLLLDRYASVSLTTKDGCWPLHTAAGRGYLKIVNMLLDKGSYVDAKNNDNKTPLFEASYWGQVEVVKILLQKGADVNIKTKSDGSVALHAAALRGHLEILKMLLDVGVLVDVRNSDDRTPLFEASYGGQEDVARILIEKGANVSIKRKQDGWSPIHIAAAEGHEGIIKILLQQGVDVNTKDNDDKTPLFIASDNGKENVVILLLNHGADMHAKTKADGFVAMHPASSHGDVSMVNHFLNLGVNVNVKSNDDRTPLHEASFWGRGNLVRFLIERGANVNITRSNGGFSVLHAACQEQGGSVDVIKQLIVLMDINIMNNENKTPLFEAAYWGHEYAVQTLIESGADVNIKLKDGGWSVLHYACQRVANLNVIKQLVGPIDVDVRTVENKTPLFEAAFYGHYDACKYLLDKGADPNVKGTLGTPKDGAKSQGHLDVLELLNQYGK